MPNWWTGRNVRGEMSPWEMLGMSGEMSGKMTGHQQLRWLSGRSWSRNHKHISAVAKTWITNTVDGQKLWRTELWPRSAPPHPPFSLWVAISFWGSSESGRLNSMALKRGIKQSQVYRQIVYLLEGNLFYLKPQLFHLIPSNASVPLHEERRRVGLVLRLLLLVLSWSAVYTLRTRRCGSYTIDDFIESIHHISEVHLAPGSPMYAAV